MVCNIGVVTIFVGCIRKHLCRSLAFNKVARFKISRNSKGKTCAWVSFVIKFKLKKKKWKFHKKTAVPEPNFIQVASVSSVSSDCWYTCIFIATLTKNPSFLHYLFGMLLLITGKSGNCLYSDNIIWDKVLKNGACKICGRQPLKNFTWSILEYYVPYLLAEVVSSIKWSNVVHFCKGRQENPKNLFLRTLI